LDRLGLITSSETEPLLVVDCTLGYGGHSSHILKAIAKRQEDGSKLIAFDQDPLEIAKTDQRLREKLVKYFEATNETTPMRAELVFQTVIQNFETLGPYLKNQGKMGRVTSLLADLGLSSMQIDDNSRGFTYKRDGPLDMRMNNEGQRIESAYELLCRLKPPQLKSMLSENSDEVFASEISAALVGKGMKIPETTLELAERVREIVYPLLLSVQGNKRNGSIAANTVKKQLDSTVARVMQAIRIEVNGEFRALETLLADLPDILAPGARAVFLTFHSGEDRRVKKAFKEGFKNGVYSDWSKEVIRASNEERRDNPRSSCCKLRWVIRSTVPRARQPSTQCAP
jgi:16S rRNA (cytosine1402-N4)-methyltransferase